MNPSPTDIFSLQDQHPITSDIEALLEALPVGACLIGRDRKILHANSHIRESVSGHLIDRICFDALAGLSEACFFCPLDDLIAGHPVEVKDVMHIRHGRKWLIDVRHMPVTPKKTIIILETMKDLTSMEFANKGQNMLPELLGKLSGLLVISRALIGSASFEAKMDSVLKQIEGSLGKDSGVIAWAEIDGKIYGRKPSELTGLLWTEEINVEDEPRGMLHANWSQEREIAPEDKYFLQEAADLIGRQVEISDLWARLRESEERHRKLASNLAKEMWSRTEALAKETAYLEGILRCSHDMIITTDLDSRIVEFNPAAEKILGYTAEEVQGRKITDLWVDASERTKIMEDVLLAGGVSNYQTRLRTKTGETKEISLTLSLLKDEEGNILGTVGVSKDISVENATRRELERLNQNYREAIHFINHEMKNSLIVMGGFLRRLIQTESDLPRKDQLQIIYHHAKFLEAMSRDFLVMAEIEHGDFQVRKKPIANFYEEVILPAMVGLKERYPDSFQSYDESMGGVGAIQLMGDPALLEIVYRNLFGNALKYRYPNKKVAYGVVDLGSRFLFNVWNEGPGVPYDQVDKIFEKFYRVHDHHTKDKRGTGLGLYNTRRIIEAHGGRIWCETLPGQWINFLFEIPKE